MHPRLLLTATLTTLTTLVTLVCAGCAAGGGGASTAAASGAEAGAAAAHLTYRVAIADEPGGGVDQAQLVRGWLTVAGLTAMPCEDVAAAPPRSLWTRLGDLLVPPAYAGHSADGLPAWQVLGSQVVALHIPGSRDYGLASEAPAALCGAHVLLGRAEQDAPSLVELPAEVTMARMTLHLELALPGGGSRQVRTDVGWGVVRSAAPGLGAGDGTLTVTFAPVAALAAAAAAVDLAADSDKDVGRAVLQALLDGMQLAYAAD